MERLKEIRARLLSWYTRHHRDLPWRHTRDPYHIWVSEVMLQQTQVATVVPYYQRFIHAFPTIDALAEADFQDVLKVWENLGYYGRARNLHKAAGLVSTEYGSKLPEERKTLLRIPGIGPYTAAAILSIAFDQPIPVVDGNVRRVISRLCLVRTPLGQAKTEGKVQQMAQTLMPRRNAGRFNQAMMELGAMICTPKRPSCDRCPVEAYCPAFKEGLQEALPVMKKRKALPHKEATAAIIEDDADRLLVVQRPESGLLGGLWKFPGGMSDPAEDPEAALKRSVREELGIEIQVMKRITSVKHTYTHFRLTLLAYRSALKRGKPKALGCLQWRWVDLRELSELPFSKVDRKVMKVL